LTREFLLYSTTEALKNAPKTYFGESLPKYIETNLHLFRNSESDTHTDKKPAKKSETASKFESSKSDI